MWIGACVGWIKAVDTCSMADYSLLVGCILIALEFAYSRGDVAAAYDPVHCLHDCVHCGVLCLMECSTDLKCHTIAIGKGTTFGIATLTYMQWFNLPNAPALV